MTKSSILAEITVSTILFDRLERPGSTHRQTKIAKHFGGPHWPAIAIALVLVALATAISGGLIWHHKSQPYHFRTVTPGVLYRSGTLAPHDWDKVIDRFGIKTIVNLRHTDEYRMGDWYEQEAAVCRRRGVQLVNLPFVPKMPPSDEHTARWLALFQDESNLPVLVHCHQGVIRTGAMVAIYEMEYQRKDNGKTLADLPLFGHRQRDYMERFILEYVPRWKRPARSSDLALGIAD